VIFGVLEDSTGCFWISMNKGLCRWDRVHQEIHAFTVADGLQANEFKEQAYCGTRSGCCISGYQWIQRRLAGAYTYDHFDPPLVMTNFQIFNQKCRSGRVRTGRRR